MKLIVISLLLVHLTVGLGCAIELVSYSSVLVLAV